MSSGIHPHVKLFAVFASVMKMVVDSVRDPEQVHRYLQRIVDTQDFISILYQPSSASVDTTPKDGWASEWTRFYHEVFGLTVDWEGIKLSDDQPGFGWTVYVASGITQNRVWAKCRDMFPCNSYFGDDLDRVVPTNARTSSSAYAKRFRNRVSADEELKNMSANDLAKREIKGITVLERMLMELWYHWKTGGGHLDLVTVTLCAGSRNADGNVPDAYWSAGQFQLDCYYPGHARGHLRTRSAV